ncbi:MAG: O-antigen ligase family protein [Bryobacterales bacterium]|nr:O-antigen ligase family protein [Bryobacterales bacterium]
MPPTLAALIYCAGIAGLFWLQGKATVRPSGALWIPLCWFMLACSRPVSGWLTPEGASIPLQMSEGNPVDRALLSMLLILASLVLLSRLRTLGPSLRMSWALALFLFYCLVSIAWSDYPDVAFKRLVREAGNWIMVLVICTEPQPLEAVLQLTQRSAYILLPLSVLFVKYYPFGRAYGYWNGETLYVGVTDNKNSLGMICLLFGVASVWRLLALAGPLRRMTASKMRSATVHCIVIALAGYLAVKANSVTALSCGVLVIGVLLLMRFRILTRQRFTIHAVVLLAVCIPLLALFVAPNPEAFEAVGRNATLTDRTMIWAAVLKLVPNDWLGTGYASFWLGPRLNVMIENVTHTWVPNQAHNGYLEVFVNLGWVGVGLLAVLLVSGYLKVIAACRKRETASDLMLAYFLIGIISNISEASFFRNLSPAWLFFLIAIIVPSQKAKRWCPPERRWAKWRENRVREFSACEAAG